MRTITEAEFDTLRLGHLTFGRTGNKEYIWAWDLEAKEFVRVEV